MSIDKYEGFIDDLDTSKIKDKKIEFKSVEVNIDDPEEMLEAANRLASSLELKGQVSDGYHTFEELYEHRYALFIALANTLFTHNLADVYIAEANADGTTWDESFLCVVNAPNGQISYHLPNRLRKELSEDMPVFETDDQYDGHTSQDVIERLLKLDL